MKTALVTGGTRGIGRAVAQRLRKGGYQVAITGRRPVEQWDDELKREFLCLCADNAQEAGREAAVQAVLKAYGRIDLLVNNAGMAPKVRADLLEMSEASMREVLEVNLIGPFFLTQRVAREMITQGSGMIINISSMSAYTVSVNRGEYCVSKAGLSMMTQLFAVRLAEAGIPVYEIRPGIIKTDMTQGVSGKYDALIQGGLTPIKRWGQPEDVAEAVAMLSENRIPFSTGEVINVDGGFHLQRL